MNDNDKLKIVRKTKFIATWLVLIIPIILIIPMLSGISKLLAMGMIVISPLCYVGLTNMKKWGLFIFTVFAVFIILFWPILLIFLYQSQENQGYAIVLFFIPVFTILFVVPLYILALIQLWRWNSHNVFS